jgi:hypothetical protein
VDSTPLAELIDIPNLQDPVAPASLIRFGRRLAVKHFRN